MLPFFEEKSLTARYVQFYAVRGKRMENMTLREVCSAFGVSRRAVQGYEKESLVSATGRNDRGHLLYNTEAQERIKKIKLFRDMGFSIKEVKVIIDDQGEVLKAALLDRTDKLNQEIQKNTAMIHIIQEMLEQL